MRPSKPTIVALALFFLLLGVPSLVAKDSKEKMWVHRPDAGDASDPGTIEGDPWQDDEGGGLNFAGRPSGYTVISIWSSPFFKFHIILGNGADATGVDVNKTITTRKTVKSKAK